MSEIAATDTHALIWYAQGHPNRLGRRARRIFERADEGKGVVYVPAMVFAELSEAVRAGEFIPRGGFERWCAGLLRSRRFVPVDLTLPIVQRSHGLFTIPERGDRLIAATALEMGVPLVTRDPEIATSGVEVIW